MFGSGDSGNLTLVHCRPSTRAPTLLLSYIVLHRKDPDLTFFRSAIASYR
jgi:hypothetical protein